MRKNLPITDNERKFPAHQKLISSTDLNGTIVHCNGAFVEVSGFTREELIGQPHNVVRYPDMPPAAYQNMWSHLKAGRPWMGLVKNRCKNGDYYWVSAYVTPVTEAGKVVGYESVRSSPSHNDVERAAKLYRRINEGGGLVRWYEKVPLVTTAFLAMIVIAAGLYGVGYPILAMGVLSISLLASILWKHSTQNNLRAAITRLLGNSFSDTLAAKSFTDDPPEQGRIKVAVMAQKAHLDAVLTRLEDSANQVTSRSVYGLEVANQTQEALLQQQGETEQVAAAVHEMSMTISEVSSNVRATASRAEDSRVLMAI